MIYFTKCIKLINLYCTLNKYAVLVFEYTDSIFDVINMLALASQKVHRITFTGGEITGMRSEGLLLAQEDILNLQY